MISLNKIIENLDIEFEVLTKRLNGSDFCSIFEPIENGISWLHNIDESALTLLRDSTVAIVFCKKINTVNLSEVNQTLIFVDNPQLVFLRLVKQLSNKIEKIPIGINPTSLISSKAIIGKNVSIGAYVQIFEAVIGDDVVIKSYSTIHDRAQIGDRVLISEYCNIGGVGFGFIINEGGNFENQSHIGSVTIEDDVDIFPYTNVDRATLGTTLIGRGTKIDHYCHIGHNSKIGYDNIITANVTICGSVIIGNQCFIGAGTQIRESIKIGNNVTIGMSSTITKNVPNEETWLGSPAIEISKFRK